MAYDVDEEEVKKPQYTVVESTVIGIFVLGTIALIGLFVYALVQVAGVWMICVPIILVASWGVGTLVLHWIQ